MLVEQLRNNRVAVSMAVDTTAWLVSFVVFTWLRFDTTGTDGTAAPWDRVGAIAVATVALYLVVGWATQLFRGRAKVASLDEMLLLGATIGLVGGVVFLANLAFQWAPRSVPAGAALGTLVLAAWARAAWRRLGERDAERRPGGVDTRRVLIVGAGEAGNDLVRSMLHDPQHTWRPVGFLDDDPRKRHLRLRGVPVLGTTAQLAETAARLEVGTVVLALPSADADTISRLRLAATRAGLGVKVLPANTQLLSDQVGIRDLRDINLTDVLGRHQLDTDVDAIADYLRGRRVLVTGAGGSIGAELCRQIHRYAPAELMMLDRDESALHAVQLSIHGRALLDTDEVILCDIRDEAAVNQLFLARRPEVVFHAAALKHLPMLEQYPAEAVKTNVIGTRIVLDAAVRVGVTTFVNVSTDKAANPCSVLGYSKRIAERITAQRAEIAAGTFLSVRFGNVLGSRGSVLTSFAKQISEGGPVTVTDPQVTRFFMTIEEACQLVIQAAAIGNPGEALVLDMGEPVLILDVARQLIEQFGTPVDIVYTGLREGEKLHEDLFGDDEPRDLRPTHPMVSHVPVPAIDEEEITSLPTLGAADDVRRSMALLCVSNGPLVPSPAAAGVDYEVTH
ncbi:nucleoside-diphosphate sugar epimerase/dehydratase [Nocardioides dongxiaopingii]|uniref:nucleoside-diphosphate sugar epimerase/dehydratase n=1 Tax=Nocardioides sp. S-1144 TaxID=2582905 RepID=UPI0021CB5F2E|nr:nucleoside-diphosphate sugar epimerase/dehydratase [Nocardioides sp. S-1144]